MSSMRRAVAATVTMVLVGGGVFAGVAAAADASGCQGRAVSFDSSGIPVSDAKAPGAGGTQNDPLVVVGDGRVDWSGSTDSVIKNGSWSVKVSPANAGLVGERFFDLFSGSLFSGDIDNESGKRSTSGSKDVSEFTTTSFLTGVYKVKWSATGNGAACTGTAFIELAESPWKSPMFYIAILMLLIGLGVLGSLLLKGPVNDAGVATTEKSS